MILKFEVTFDDMLDFNMFHALNSPTIKKTLTIQRFILVPGIYLVMALFFTYISGYKSIRFFLPAFIILSILVALVYPKRFKWRMKRNLIKMLKEGKNTGVGEQTLNMSPEEIIETNEFKEIRLKWSSIQKIVKTEKSVLMYTSSASAIIIPFRTFNSKEKAEDFIRVTQNFLKESKHDHSMGGYQY